MPVTSRTGGCGAYQSGCTPGRFDDFPRRARSMPPSKCLPPRREYAVTMASKWGEEDFVDQGFRKQEVLYTCIRCCQNDRIGARTAPLCGNNKCVEEWDKELIKGNFRHLPACPPAVQTRFVRMGIGRTGYRMHSSNSGRAALRPAVPTSHGLMLRGMVVCG